MVRRQKAIDEQLKKQDEYLGIHDHDQCIEKMVCIVASRPDSKLNENPLTFLSNLSLGMQENGGGNGVPKNEALKHISQFEHLQELINAAKYGHSVQSSHECETHFSDCQVNIRAITKVVEIASNVNKLVAESPEQIIKELSEVQTQTIKRDLHQPTDKRGCNKAARDGACSSLGILCPGLGIACGLCAIITGGACAFGCGPALAGVCAGTATACALASKAC